MKYQHGEEYINRKGNLKVKKAVKEKICLKANCVFLCTQTILHIERVIINAQFWAFDDDGKTHFY